MAQIKSATKDAKYLIDAYQYVEKHIFVDVTTLAEGIAVSYNTAARVVNTMVELKILSLRKAQERNRVFLYSDFLSIIADG